jgi:AcrR family transcriptional regulator
MKTRPIPEETRATILDAAWALMAEAGRLDVSLSAIAAAARVSRQTLYLAFGGRAGLLTAMLRHRDSRSDHVARLSEISARPSGRAGEFVDYVGVWLDYLPMIYPVGILLHGAALNDPEAAEAWDDRMKRALLAGMRRILRAAAREGRLAPGLAADAAAELAWSLVHPASWRLLVAECGWSAEAFRRSRLALIAAFFTA